MKYFGVKKEELVGNLTSGVVYGDGEYAEEPDETECRTMTIGYNVWEYNEDGTTDRVVFYKVDTDTEAWTDNEDEVLEKIKADHPAGEWQNNNW